MSSFFKSDTKPAAAPTAAAEPAPARSVDRVAEQPSVLGRGMQITGNIVSTGSVQIHGRVTGDIQAAQLVVCEGARVEGKVIAQDTVIQGTFNGNIHSTTLKLQKTAKVDGEIFSRSLMIEQDAQFEGVSRKLDKPVDAPGATVAAVAAPSVAPSNVTALRVDPSPLAR